MHRRIRYTLKSLALTAAILSLTACPPEPEDPEICTKADVPGGCDGGTIVVGTPPDCECIVPGGEEPPIIQTPGGGDGGGVIRATAASGWTIIAIDADVASVNVIANHAEHGPISTHDYAVDSQQVDDAEWDVSVDDLGGEVLGATLAGPAAVRVTWDGPIDVEMINPQSQTVQHTLNLGPMLMPVSVQGAGPGKVKLIGNKPHGPLNIELAFDIATPLD